VFGGQLERLIGAQDPLELGPPPGPTGPLDPLLERVIAHLTTALGRAFAGGDPVESLELARLAAGVGDDHPHADVFATILWLLDLYAEHIAPPPPGRAFPDAARFVVTALVLARTPRACLPPDLPASAASASHAHAERGTAAAAPEPPGP
jgi:hypothetical protein